MSLAITGATLDGDEVVLRAENGVIAEVGGDVSARDGDEVLDGSGTAIVPGLVNSHTHAAMTLFRGFGDDLPLMEWLQSKIWPTEAKLDADDVYWGARLACVEMIRAGTVRFWDMYWQPEATARAVVDAGMRSTIGAPLIDTGMGAASLRNDAIESLDALEGIERVDRALAPHAIYTVSEESLRWIGEQSAERDLPIHIHLSETEGEVNDCVKEHGDRPAAYLDRTGALGPRTLLAHGVWLDDAELDLIAERGATVVSNPVANLKLAAGRVFDYPAVKKRGIGVALGTDGAGSNNSLDVLQDVKYLSLLQKHEARDPAARAAARRATPPTSCSCGRTPRSWRSATSSGTSSTRRRARWSTRRSSPAACSCAAGSSRGPTRCACARSSAPAAWGFLRRRPRRAARRPRCAGSTRRGWLP